MRLAEDGSDGNGLQPEKVRLTFSSCFRASSNKKLLELKTMRNHVTCLVEPSLNEMAVYNALK